MLVCSAAALVSRQNRCTRFFSSMAAAPALKKMSLTTSAEGRKAEASLRVLRHLESRHLAGKDRADGQHAVLGNEGRIDNRDSLRSRPLEPAHVPAVVIDHHIADRNQTPGHRRRRSFAGNE